MIAEACIVGLALAAIVLISRFIGSMEEGGCLPTAGFLFVITILCGTGTVLAIEHFLNALHAWLF